MLAGELDEAPRADLLLGWPEPIDVCLAGAQGVDRLSDEVQLQGVGRPSQRRPPERRFPIMTG